MYQVTYILLTIDASNTKPAYFQKKGTSGSNHKNMGNHTMMVSPKNSNLTAKKIPGTTTSRTANHRNRLNRSMVSSSDGMQRFGTVNMKKYLLQKSKMNPLAAIEKGIDGAKYKLEKSEKYRLQSNEAGDETMQLVLLNKENLTLRDELRLMNDDLNKFIDILKEYKNLKTTRQKFILPKQTSKDSKMKAKGAEKKNYQQIMVNMKEEHKHLKKRLNVVGDPTYA